MNAATAAELRVTATQAAMARALEQRVAATQTAINRLMAKRRRVMERAARARAGSHEREQLLAMARNLAAFCQMLATDGELAGQLDHEGMLDAGWEPLCRRIVALARQRQRAESKGTL